MTCIVGIKGRMGIVIGADSCSGDTGHWLQQEARNPKLFVVDGPKEKADSAIVGFTTSWRMGQLLQHAFEPPARHPSDDVLKYLVTEWCKALRKSLSDAAWLEKKDERVKGGTFLLAYRGRLFAVYEDFTVLEPASDEAAVGCGWQLAYGALHATRGSGLTAAERVLKGLQAASSMSAFVRPPFVLKRIDTNGLVYNQEDA